MSTAFFYTLKLTREDYNDLKDYGGNHLVFQFFYPSTGAPPGDSPTLAAYGMKQHNKSIDSSQQDKFQRRLSYLEPSTEPLSGRDQYLGDLQIKFKDLENLKNTYNPEEYEYFIFTPEYNIDNKHLYYTITVFPKTVLSKTALPTNVSSKTKHVVCLDPSPPYSSCDET